MSIKRFIKNEPKKTKEEDGGSNKTLNNCSISLNNQEYSCRTGETVLEALLRQHVDVPYACRRQVCQECLMRSLNAPPPPASQVGIRATLKDMNYFLACACVPVEDMEIALAESVTREVSAKIIQLEKLNDKVMAVFLLCEQPLDYRAGQSIIFMNHEKLGKNFHIASASSEKENGIIEIHVPLFVGAYFSEWVHKELKTGDTVSICGPIGHHFYLTDNLQQPLLMIAENIGLSPLIGILQDALEAGHNAPIYLFHSAVSYKELYLVNDLFELSQNCANFNYCPSTLAVEKDCLTGSADALALEKLRDLNNYRVFICGFSGFVKQAQKNVYLSGAATKDIYSIFLSH